MRLNLELRKLKFNFPSQEIIINTVNHFSAAYLTAAGISCILSRMQKKFVTVGIDGSVYRFHPKFDKILDSKINDLLPKNLDVCPLLRFKF